MTLPYLAACEIHIQSHGARASFCAWVPAAAMMCLLRQGYGDKDPEVTGCLVWYHSQQHACRLGRRVRRTAAGAAQRCTTVCNIMDKGRTTPGHDVQGCPGWSCAAAVASDCA